MSYILDALNKSEKDRASKSMPGMREQHNNQPERAMSSGQIFISLTALVIVNCLGVYWYFGPDEPSQSPLPASEPAARTSASNQTTSSSYSPDTKGPVTAQIRSDATPIAISPNLTPTAPQQSDLEAADETMTTAIGPPAVEITAHLYADDAAFRMVNINGIARREGDTLAGGYRVLSITESGVILGLGEDQYELNVVEDWQLVPTEQN